jgi:hypothetical protein
LTARKLFLTARKLFLTARKPFLTARKLFLTTRKLTLLAKQPVFPSRSVYYNKNYRRFAPLEEFLGAFLPALPVLRLIAQTTAAETAAGCPQTPNQRLPVQRPCALEFR